MRYSATWLSMCWAATMCCPSWLVWICWAGPDGLLKALPYGIPETLWQFIPPHSDSKLLTPAIVIITIIIIIVANSYASFSLSVISLCYSKAKCLIDLGDRLSLHFRGTVCIPLDVLYYCISMYLVAFMCYYFQTVYVQLRQSVPCPTQNGTVPLPAADLLAHAVSTPKQCERCKEGLVYITHCIWKCNSI